MARFIDRVVLHLQAGDGGHGCVSVHREKFKPCLLYTSPSPRDS